MMFERANRVKARPTGRKPARRRERRRLTVRKFESMFIANPKRTAMVGYKELN